MKDYLRNDQPEENKDLQKLRSLDNPTGKDRKNRLGRDFNNDISKRRDQVTNRHKENDVGPWDPQEYL